MAVRKFRSVEEMPGPPPLPPMDPDNLKLLIGITDVAYGFHPWRFPPGVRRFRSLEEAQEQELSRYGSALFEYENRGDGR